MDPGGRSRLKFVSACALPTAANATAKAVNAVTPPAGTSELHESLEWSLGVIRCRGYSSADIVTRVTRIAPPIPCCTSPFLPLSLGGGWGSYWYNGFIYETNITKGLKIFKLSSRVTAGARKFRLVNPQTQIGRVRRR
jgi:hypothetical protein